MAMTKQQGGSNSNWEGILKKWRLAQLYGPGPIYDEQFDVAVLQIAMMLCKVSEDEFELKTEECPPLRYFRALLNILHDYVEDIEDKFKSESFAHELHSIDCLVPLLHSVLYHPHDCIRAKAAEIVTTMVHNNPMSQQLVLEVIGLEPLLYNFTSDPDTFSRTAALAAISALIRNNTPGIIAFQLQLDDCYAKLRDALICTKTRPVEFQRDALNIIQYLIHENSSGCNIVVELGLPRIMMHFASSGDVEVRVAALRGLLVLARDEEGGNSVKNEDLKQLLQKRDDELKQVFQKRDDELKQLQKRIEGNSEMPFIYVRRHEWEERQLVDSLWNACYNEPSSLEEKGVLVLPGEDAPAPYDGSKLFEPPLGAWDAAQVTVRNPFSEKKDCNILPRTLMHMASSDDAVVRKIALRGLLVLARDEGVNSCQLVKNDDKLKQVLQERIEGIRAMAPEDLGVDAREEMLLVNSIWFDCYNEHSSLECLLLEHSINFCESSDWKSESYGKCRHH